MDAKSPQADWVSRFYPHAELQTSAINALKYIDKDKPEKRAHALRVGTILW